MIEEIKKIVTEQLEMLMKTISFRTEIENIVENLIQRKISIAKSTKEAELKEKEQQAQQQLLTKKTDSEKFWDEEENQL